MSGLKRPAQISYPRMALPRWLRDRQVLLVGVLAVACLAAWRLPSTRWLGIGLMALGAILLFLVVRRRGRLELIGPLFAYDLARVAGRGRTAMLRCLYGLLLLGWLVYLFIHDYPRLAGPAQAFEQGPALSVGDWARFARHFVHAAFSLQGVALLVLTPAYLASAIAEEKEHKTIPLLFTTGLRDREIVLGKLFSRLAHLAFILLTGLPILCLTRLWGGIDGAALLAGLVVTGASMLSIGSLSLLWSIVCRTVLGAVLSSYACVLIFTAFCLAIPGASPWIFLPQLDHRIDEAWKEWELERVSSLPLSGPMLPPVVPPVVPAPNNLHITLGVMAIGVLPHLVAFLVCTNLAISRIRELCLEPGPPERPPQPMPVLTSQWGPHGTEAGPLWHPAYVLRRPYVVRDPPLLWKETHHGGSFGPDSDPFEWVWHYPGRAAVLFLGLACLCLPMQLNPAFSSSQAMASFNTLVRGLTIALASCWCLVVAFRAAGSISRERDQDTLQTLLILPVARREILWAKWSGSILRYRYFAYLLAGIWLVALGTGILHPWAVLLLAAGCATILAFLASVGLWLSLASRNTLWANVTMALVLLLLFASVWLRLVDSQSAFLWQEMRWRDVFWTVGLNPGMSWWFSGFSWRELADGVRRGDRIFLWRLSTIPVGLAVFGVGAWVFWRLTVARFWGDGARAA
jgi:ABC-type transport system involved in multi-copper enzyme maturation permease subunit